MKDQYDEDESVVKEAEKDHRFEKLKQGDGVFQSDQATQEEENGTSNDEDDVYATAWAAHEAGDKDGWITAMKRAMGKAD